MTKAATSHKLNKFEGRDVIGARVAITGAGDGLSQALAIEPIALSLGQTVFVVIKCEVAAITMEEVKDTDSLTRKHKLTAGTSTLVDEELVGELLAAQQARIDAARGRSDLDFADAVDGD